MYRKNLQWIKLTTTDKYPMMKLSSEFLSEYENFSHREFQVIQEVSHLIFFFGAINCWKMANITQFDSFTVRCAIFSTLIVLKNASASIPLAITYLLSIIPHSYNWFIFKLPTLIFNGMTTEFESFVRMVYFHGHVCQENLKLTDIKLL